MNKMIDLIQQIAVVAACVIICVIAIRIVDSQSLAESEPVACFSRGVLMRDAAFVRDLVNQEIILMEEKVKGLPE